MKVCLVAPELIPVPPILGGAIETWIDRIGAELARAGVEVHVISVSHPDVVPGTRTEGQGSVTYHYIPVPPALERAPLRVVARGGYYFQRAGRVIRRIRPEIVHHQNRPLGLLIARGAAGVPARQVLSLQNIDYGWCLSSKRIDRLFFARGFAACDRVLAASEFIREYARRRIPGYDDARLATLYNGVDTGVFSPNGARTRRAEFGLSPDPLIMCTGRIDPRKGVHLALEVLRRVQREIPSTQLAIVGPRGSYWDRAGTDYARRIEEEVARTPGARLLGPVYDRKRLAALYATADVACLPFTSEEAFGMTSIEAQACGVPVVTTAIGGVPETLEDEVTGFLVAPGDVDGMTRRVLALLQDPALRVRMGRAARSRVEAWFSWRTLAQELMGHYRAILT